MSPPTFTDSIPEELVCPVCMNVMLDPVTVLADCLHEFCRKCMTDVMKKCVRPGNDGTFECPLDRLPFHRIAPCRKTLNRVLGLRVVCTNARRGCDWKGKYSDYLINSTLCSMHEDSK